jgi:hypothetical protein
MYKEAQNQNCEMKEVLALHLGVEELMFHFCFSA